MNGTHHLLVGDQLTGEPGFGIGADTQLGDDAAVASMLQPLSIFDTAKQLFGLISTFDGNYATFLKDHAHRLLDHQLREALIHYQRPFGAVFQRRDKTLTRRQVAELPRMMNK